MTLFNVSLCCKNKLQTGLSVRNNPLTRKFLNAFEYNACVECVCKIKCPQPARHWQEYRKEDLFYIEQWTVMEIGKIQCNQYDKILLYGHVLTMLISNIPSLHFFSKVNTSSLYLICNYEKLFNFPTKQYKVKEKSANSFKKTSHKNMPICWGF